MAHTIEQVLERPIITEKSSIQASSENKYTFAVPDWVTKNHVREAFAKFFPEHKVTKVNIGKIFAKSKRTKKGVRQGVDHKKAIVTAEGPHIDYFPEV